MSHSKSLARLTLAVVMVAIVLVMMSTNQVAEARYLPTRSDPLLPVGPPRGEDPRFDRLYDVIKELLRNGAAGEYEDAKFEPKARPVYEGGRF